MKNPEKCVLETLQAITAAKRKTIENLKRRAAERGIGCERLFFDAIESHSKEDMRRYNPITGDPIVCEPKSDNGLCKDCIRFPKE